MYLAVHEDGVGGALLLLFTSAPQAGPTESFNLHERLDPVHIGCHDQLHLPWGGLVQKDLEQQDVIIKQIRPK